MRTLGLGLSMLVTVALIDRNIVLGERLSGSLNLSYLHTEQNTAQTLRDDLTQETLLLNYEDALFTKNQMRLAGHFYRREYPQSRFHEFRPIYYLDIKSSGYSVNTSYSPYKQLTGVSAQEFYLYHRDWRNTVSVNYERWPTLGLVYNKSRTFDKQAVRRYDSQTRSLVMESNYRQGPFSGRLNYNNLRQESRIASGTKVITRTYTGALAVNHGFSRVGYFNSTYTYYDTRSTRGLDENENQITSNTHSFNSLFTSEEYFYSVLGLSYSGRFLESKVRNSKFDSQNQNVSGQVTFSPVDYLSLSAIKNYQNGNEGGQDLTVEYLVLSANSTRYLRNGVDTRLGVSRTIFQQSNRQFVVDNTPQPNRGYHLDTYYSSLGFAPYNYIRTLVDLSINRDSDPLLESQRFQISRSINGQLFFSPQLEGRFNLNALHQGSALSLSRSFSESYNLGMSYYPAPGINLNLTYIHTRTTTSRESSNNSLSGYLSYSFRRAFSIYFNFNQQKQMTAVASEESPVIQPITLRPRTINGQVLIYLTRRATLTTGYLQTKSTNLSGATIKTESLQAVLNIQV